MGLNAQDLLWVEGKSASWKHPAEIEELKCLLPRAVEKKFDRVPLQRTRLKNDSILFRTQNTLSDNNKRVLTENEVLEFPTLARFFMTEHYENYRQTIKSETQKVNAEKIDKPEKKSRIWVSLPSSSSDEKVILIRSGEIIKKKIIAIPEVAEVAAALPVIENKSENSTIILSRDIAAVENREENITPPELRILPNSSSSDNTDVQQRSFVKTAVITEPKREATKEKVREKAPVINLQQRKFSLSYSTLLQKLAVAVAIGSLLIVAYLITDSILNPAYSLQPLTVINKSATVPVKSVQASNNQTLVVPEVKTQSAEIIVEPVAAPLPMPGNEKKVKKKAVQKVADKELLVEENLTDKESASVEQAEPVSSVTLPVQVIEPRAKLSELVDIEMDGLKVGILGGIKEFDLIVKNNSDIPIDQLVVELRYIQSNKKVFKTEMLEFNDIAAQSRQMVEVPKSARGIKVESSIKSIAAKDATVALNN